MQKKPVLLIAILLLVTPCLASNVTSSKRASASTSNSIIQNGGFEEGLTGWTNDGDGFLAVSGDNVHSGNYSLEISSLISQQAYFYQFVDMPNTSFMYSFWVFRVDAKSWTACYLGRDWDGNTLRVASSLIIQDDTIQLNAWDNPHAPGRQVFNYDVTVGSWHNMTFLANATSGTQDFYIDGNLIENLNSSSGNVFNPDVLIFGDVSTDSCNGTFCFDDFELDALGTANAPAPLVRIDPRQIEALSINDAFTIYVWVDNAVAVEAVQVQFVYDPAVLNATSVVEGPFLQSAGPTVVAQAFAQNGTVYYSSAGSSGQTASGSGILLNVTFTVLSDGPSQVHLIPFISSGAHPGTYFLDARFNEIVPNLRDGFYGSAVTQLTINCVGMGSVTESPSSATYRVDTVVTLTATSDQGWVFWNWTGDVSGPQNSINITMEADKTVTAMFGLQGDVDRDGGVALADLIILAYAYGSHLGDSNWNSGCDIATPYGIVGLADLVTMANHYGQHYP